MIESRGDSSGWRRELSRLEVLTMQTELATTQATAGFAQIYLCSFFSKTFLNASAKVDENTAKMGSLSAWYV